MRVKNIEELKNILKTKLPEYLKSKGLRIDRNKVQCPHFSEHRNMDKGKISAAFLPGHNNGLIWCFVENRKFDIFDVYSILENKKIIGEGFYACLKDLAARFEIPFEIEKEYSLKEVEKSKKRLLLEKLHRQSLTDLQSAIPLYKERNISKAKLKTYKIGHLSPKLITPELDKEFKQFYEYKLSTILNYPSLVIPVFDEYKQYVGLIVRQFGCPVDDRYLNITLDGKNLFNTHNIRGMDEVYLVEGVFDAISLFPETNVLGILTNSLHDHDLEFVAKQGFKKIKIALDSDNLYQGKSRDGILKTILKLKNLDTTVEVILLPENDPDECMKKHSLEEFKKFKKISAIDYLLDNISKERIKMDIIYEYISGCPNIVTKEKLISIVSKKLGIGKRQITKEIEKLEDKNPLYNIVQYVQEKESFEELLEDFTQSAWNKDFKGISSGFPLFDSSVGGFENTIYMFIAFPESGKCLGYGTEVLMSDGSKKEAQLIQAGDFVMGDKGQAVRVTSIGGGKEEMYKVVPKKGIPWECNKSHILVVNYNTSRNLTLEISVKDFLAKSEAFQERCKLIKTKVEFPEIPLEYDPYFIGFWLGDGSVDSPSITQKSKYLDSYFKLFAENHKLKFTRNSYLARCDRLCFTGTHGSPNKLTSELRTLYFEGSKRITIKYLRNSRTNRLQLLAGLIDSDGYIDKNCYEIFTKWKSLSGDIAALAQSLGFMVTIKLKHNKRFNKNYYRVCIFGETSEIPVKYDYKKATKRVSRRNAMHVGFKLEPIGVDDYYGFTLDKNSNGRFLLGDYTITHNTTKLINFTMNLLRDPRNYVAFYSLDDGAKRAILPRMMSMVTGLTSKVIKDPNEKIQDKWHKGMKLFHSLKDNFMLKDGSHIRTLKDLDNFIKIHYAIANENGKKFIIVIDNLHAITASYRFESTENTERVANYLKRVPQQFNCPIICTAEVPKSSSKKPTGKDIKASIDLWYAARFVGGIYNDFNEKGQSNLIWQFTNPETNEERMFPIMELYVSKNQTGDCWHGSLYYKFNPITSIITECSADETKLLRDGQFLY